MRAPMPGAFSRLPATFRTLILCSMIPTTTCDGLVNPSATRRQDRALSRQPGGRRGASRSWGGLDLVAPRSSTSSGVGAGGPGRRSLPAATSRASASRRLTWANPRFLASAAKPSLPIMYMC